MKYVIFKWRSVYMPIMFPAHVTHSQIHIREAAAVSAGFFKINSLGLAVAYGESESLKLPSKPNRDSRLLNLALNNFNTVYFLVDNFTENED